jgi:hypothetical protein
MKKMISRKTQSIMGVMSTVASSTLIFFIFIGCLAGV